MNNRIPNKRPYIALHDLIPPTAQHLTCSLQSGIIPSPGPHLIIFQQILLSKKLNPINPLQQLLHEQESSSPCHRL